jgi:membrane protein DedA with SNARE-associated domain
VASDLLRLIEGLPPGPLYVVITVLAAVENVFPPVPADTAVALGAFLAGRGLMDPWLVFGLTWGANTCTAVGVYALARRYGPAVFAGPLGRRLLSERTLARIAAEYDRHGVIGIFFSRLLPVWRGMVGPFAGVVGVSPRRAVVPIVLASGVYYGALTVFVYTLGGNLEAVLAALGRVNVVLAVAALAALVAVALAWRTRRTP